MEQKGKELLSNSYLLVKNNIGSSECFFLEVDRSQADLQPVSSEDLKRYASLLKQKHLKDFEKAKKTAYAYKRIGKKVEPSKRKTSEESDFLTPKQKVVLELIARTYPNREIAAQMNISVKTVEGYLERLKNILNVETRWELADKYREIWFT